MPLWSPNQQDKGTITEERCLNEARTRFIRATLMSNKPISRYRSNEFCCGLFMILEESWVVMRKTARSPKLKERVY